ncbi:hypothetical protein M8C21_016010, partial [Ambrosia artemisiifolia]
QDLLNAKHESTLNRVHAITIFHGGGYGGVETVDERYILGKRDLIEMENKSVMVCAYEGETLYLQTSRALNRVLKAKFVTDGSIELCVSFMKHGYIFREEFLLVVFMNKGIKRRMKKTIRMGKWMPIVKMS